MFDASILTSTPLSLTADILITIVLAIFLTIYIIRSGAEKIILLALATYAAIAIKDVVFFQLPSAGGFSGGLLLLILLIVACFFALNRSIVGSGIFAPKKNRVINIAFGVSVVGLLLSQIIPYISLLNTPYSRFLRQSLFGQEVIQLIWSIAPLVFLLLIPTRKTK